LAQAKEAEEEGEAVNIIRPQVDFTGLPAEEFYKAVSRGRTRLNADDATQLLELYMSEQGLKEAGWIAHLETDTKFRKVNAGGCCDLDTKVIWINWAKINGDTPARIRDILLHEIAHALCPTHGHDEVWSDKALEIGMRPVGLALHMVDRVWSEVFEEEKRI
jgi:hypothetical protein